MKAQELNGTHLGQRMTVTSNGNSVTGVLGRVDHNGDILTETNFAELPREVLGRKWVHLVFLGITTTTCNPEAEVTVHG
jgi:hypothetical protein